MLMGLRGMNKLKSSTVVLFGSEGLGPMQRRPWPGCGVGRLILVDNDTVSCQTLTGRVLRSTVPWGG